MGLKCPKCCFTSLLLAVKFTYSFCTCLAQGNVFVDSGTQERDRMEKVRGRQDEEERQGQERDRERCLDCKRRVGYHSLQDSNSCCFSYKRKTEICGEDEELWGVDGKGVSENHVCKNHENSVMTAAFTMTSADKENFKHFLDENERCLSLKSCSHNYSGFRVVAVFLNSMRWVPHSI